MSTLLSCFLQLVELKNGETYNGHLVNCDNWMNIQLREVICTSRVSGLAHSYSSCKHLVILSFMFLFPRMVIVSGRCQSVSSEGAPSSTSEYLMRYVHVGGREARGMVIVVVSTSVS